MKRITQCLIGIVAGAIVVGISGGVPAMAATSVAAPEPIVLWSPASSTAKIGMLYKPAGVVGFQVQKRSASTGWRSVATCRTTCSMKLAPTDIAIRLAGIDSAGRMGSAGQFTTVIAARGGNEGTGLYYPVSAKAAPGVAKSVLQFATAHAASCAIDSAAKKTLSKAADLAKRAEYPPVPVAGVLASAILSEMHTSCDYIKNYSTVSARAVADALVGRTDIVTVASAWTDGSNVFDWSHCTTFSSANRISPASTVKSTNVNTYGHPKAECLAIASKGFRSA